MKDTPWILVDTETTGIRPPIFVVEIGAQRMRGWAPEGPPFQRLLNQNRDIPPEAARVHGYTKEILERDGEPAEAVYEAFADYVGDLPLVAYNLQYDLDQVLRPEWKRLGIDQIGVRGFCALRLAQRLLDPVPAGNCKLQTLRQYYRLPQRGAHTALGDVETVVDLLGQVLRPLAEQRGLDSWQSVCDFTTQDWYPTRIAFGAFKGRLFWDAETDSASARLACRIVAIDQPAQRGHRQVVSEPTGRGEAAGNGPSTGGGKRPKRRRRRSAGHGSCHLHRSGH